MASAQVGALPTFQNLTLFVAIENLIPILIENLGIISNGVLTTIYGNWQSLLNP
jgi:hypothetical protein